MKASGWALSVFLGCMPQTFRRYLISFYVFFFPSVFSLSCCPLACRWYLWSGKWETNLPGRKDSSVLLLLAAHIHTCECTHQDQRLPFDSSNSKQTRAQLALKLSGQSANEKVSVCQRVWTCNSSCAAPVEGRISLSLTLSLSHCVCVVHTEEWNACTCMCV